MKNRIYKKSKIRLINRCLKNAPRLLKSWKNMHPNWRKQFPTNFVDTVRRSIKIYNKYK